MDLNEYAVPITNGYSKVGKNDNISKLHSLVNELEIDSGISVKSDKNFDDEKESFGEVCSLDEVEPINDIEFDTDMTSEDSWLYQSPSKMLTPQCRSKNTEVWLKENVSTPDLLRVRGSLSARLEVIGIESRKEHYNSARRKESYEMRKMSKTSKNTDFGSVMSLDWDFDDSQLEFGDGESNYSDDIDSELDSISTDNIHNSEVRKQRRLEQARQAWTDTGNRLPQNNEEKVFKLNWSDEEELEPMRMNFNSPIQEEQRYKSGLTYQRSGSGLSSDGFAAKPSGLVRPRGAQPKDSGTQQSTSEDAAFQPIKRSISFAKQDIILQDLDDPEYNLDAGRGPRIAKPVPRRNLETASESNLLKPRGAISQLKSSSSALTMPKSISDNNVNDSVVRRRGAPTPIESSGAPRKSMEPPQVARVQGIPQVRKSTGSLPKRDENQAKPRRSVSPSAIARPRGQPVARSYQADF